MRKNPPPEWALDADLRLKRLCLNRRQLAEMLNINYTLMCNTMTGYLSYKPEIKTAILAKLDELESKGGCENE